MAHAFVKLQQYRHDADYDLAATLSSADVKAYIGLAERAIATWRAFKTATPDLANVFLVSLMHASPR